MNTSVEARFAPSAVRRDVSLRAWVARCAAAEAIGMSAAAAAARYTDHVLIDRTTLTIVLAGACILTAGLVEGTALGIAQAGAMRRLTPDLPVGRYVMVTVAMAGVGWAAGSVPSLTADSSSSSSAPAWPLMLLLGGLMGATMGGLLGVAQSLVLRKHTTHAWRWAGANLAAWTPAMAILMVGASLPLRHWSLLVVLVWALAVGVLAGATLGLILGWFSSSLLGGKPHDRMVLAALRLGRPELLTRSVVGLRLTGRHTLRSLELPVMYAEDDAALWIAVGHADHKQWWRNVGEQPYVEVLRNGSWRASVAELVVAGEPGFEAGLACYRQRWPKVALGSSGPLVRIVDAEAPMVEPKLAAN